MTRLPLRLMSTTTKIATAHQPHVQSSYLPPKSRITYIQYGTTISDAFASFASPHPSTALLIPQTLSRVYQNPPPQTRRMPTATALSNLPTGDDSVCVDNWLETHVVPKPRGRSSSVRDCISGRLSDIQEDLCYLSFRGAEDNCDRRQPCRRKGLDYRHPVSEFEEAACKMMGEMHEGHGQCEPKPLRASPADCEENQLKPELRKKLKVMGAALLGLATLVLRN